MQEFYKILGIAPDATNEEVEASYKVLKEKYSKERFYEGEIGNEAARKLTKVEMAYQEIMDSRKQKSTTEEGKEAQDFSEVQRAIKNGNIVGAQDLLDNYSVRDAEWHYLQSVVFFKKNWLNESKKQLEISVNMDPYNEKYADALTKLKQKIEFNEKQFRSGNMGGYYDNTTHEPQMGGSDTNSCMSCCATWCLTNLLCNMCCR